MPTLSIHQLSKKKKKYSQGAEYVPATYKYSNKLDVNSEAYFSLPLIYYALSGY